MKKWTGIVLAAAMVFTLAGCAVNVSAAAYKTVNGVTERRGSGDGGVLIGSKEGDIVPDSFGGAAWTVSSRIPRMPTRLSSTPVLSSKKQSRRISKSFLT